MHNSNMKVRINLIKVCLKSPTVWYITLGYVMMNVMIIAQNLGEELTN